MAGEQALPLFHRVPHSAIEIGDSFSLIDWIGYSEERGIICENTPVLLWELVDSPEPIGKSNKSGNSSF